MKPDSEPPSDADAVMLRKPDPPRGKSLYELAHLPPDYDVSHVITEKAPPFRMPSVTPFAKIVKLDRTYLMIGVKGEF